MFSVMREDGDFADVTLACEDESIKAHQVVLSASSLFFRNLLKTLSHPHPIVYMRGVKADHLSALLDFIYLGNTEITQDLVSDFLLLAEELKVEGLGEKKWPQFLFLCTLLERLLSQLSNPSLQSLKASQLHSICRKV